MWQCVMSTYYQLAFVIFAVLENSDRRFPVLNFQLTTYK